ncbi:MAG: glycosyltransferase family 39 protein, partial [Acidimicrobiia bacterium]
MARSVTRPRLRRGGELTPVLAVAAAVALFHLLLGGRYGFHRDELYYLAAGRHPALGYVDQPPVVPLLARAITETAGQHLWPLRAVAGAAHAAVVVLGALIARQLGGGRRALMLAAVATATMPLLVAAGSLFGTVVFDQVWWALALLLVVRLLDGADPRWWIGVGAVMGLGLETKWTIALLGAGLAMGFAAVPQARRHLARPWPWAGAAVALALWSPNLVWQALNGWPTLEFVRNTNAGVRAEDGRLGFVVLQAGMVGPLALPLVGAGLVRLWRSRTWRPLAVATASVAAALLVVGGKAYYLGPLWVLAAGAGAVAAERWIDAQRWSDAEGW